MTTFHHRLFLATAILGIGVIATAADVASAQQKRPNIVIIWGDDIGQSNISAYTRGLMGYRTRNIDRIAREGMLFTDYYAEQSCTAGRASFITGQHGMRTGLTKVGLPGATLGLQKEDPTIAALLKARGYATGQFGKNHLGDRNEFLPTVHGFDEFYGNLYHLNAEEEPEHRDYPKDPKFRAKYGPRGVLDCRATDTDDPTVDPRFAESASRRSKTLARLPRSAWRRLTMTRRSARPSSSGGGPRPANRSSSGSTSRTCTFARMSSLAVWGNQGVG